MKPMLPLPKPFDPKQFEGIVIKPVERVVGEFYTLIDGKLIKR